MKPYFSAQRAVVRLRVHRLTAGVLVLALQGLWASENIGLERSRLHAIQHRGPAVDFFSGALLGNGGLGAVVTTRPDAIVVFFGHNNVWDIRIAENHREEIGAFEYVFKRVEAIPDTLKSLTENSWYKNYAQMARDNYRQPYPRPFPCGALLLGFDRRRIQVLGHVLDLSSGLCRIDLRIDREPASLELFTFLQQDELWFRLLDQHGRLRPNCFDRIRLIPDPSTVNEFAPASNAGSGIAFYQRLPFRQPPSGEPQKNHPKDRAFQLEVQVSCPLSTRERLDWEGNPKAMDQWERSLKGETPLIGCAALWEGLADSLAIGTIVHEAPSADRYAAVQKQNQRLWADYWGCSAVVLSDAELEKIWYRNLYFLNCSAKAGVTCPGLFANWSYQQIGTAWHGDYHMNYNTQQPFWATFSSNHLDKNLPYVDLVEKLMPVSRRWAKEYYNLPGAYFPHSAYPVEMTMNPYPAPDWGWEICETPWTVQGLWWHYLYSMDVDYLRTRAFIPIAEAVRFLVAYMQRPEAHGPQWGDDRYHIFPTVPPELYGLKPGFKYNYDCLVDLTLTKFIFKAYLQAVDILKYNRQEASTVRAVRTILEHFPDYPTAMSSIGPVYVSVPGEHAEVVYNVPNSLMTVFPGEEHGLHSPAEILHLLENSLTNMQIEGGNDLVFLNLQAARLGRLDLEKFKQQAAYCEIDNGAYTDMVLQVHGRYSDTTTPFDFMARMGIWFENFGLPVVINECLLQSYNGVIRLFPNWPKDQTAAFHQLRCVGAVLISAEFKDGEVSWVAATSERGGPMTLLSPWPLHSRISVDGKATRVSQSEYTFSMKPGQTLVLKKE
ncbi:MAG TPA: hypothetical protein PK843_18600 [bacterium]|nr:hypothetical protein [bacterium]